MMAVQLIRLGIENGEMMTINLDVAAVQCEMHVEVLHVLTVNSI